MVLGSVGPVTFFYQNKNNMINYFFQTQAHWPWVIFCEEHISDHIFIDRTFNPPPTHLYYIQGK